MKFSELQKVIEMMDDYMCLVISYNPEVCGITYHPEKEFEFLIGENGNTYPLFVKNWEIYNRNGDKCIEIMRNAYDTFSDMMAAINRFEEKWKAYKK